MSVNSLPNTLLFTALATVIHSEMSNNRDIMSVNGLLNTLLFIALATVIHSETSKSSHGVICKFEFWKFVRYT